jgi:predicted lysophospholipase L1 biosynthesis ABC-type transport system permease subunit
VSGADAVDERRFNEKLDDLQAAHPFPYNLAVGAVMALVLLLFGLHPVLAALYIPSYAALRWFLWQDGRVLRRQYDARKVRCAQEAAEKRRRR